MGIYNSIKTVAALAMAISVSLPALVEPLQLTCSGEMVFSEFGVGSTERPNSSSIFIDAEAKLVTVGRYTAELKIIGTDYMWSILTERGFQNRTPNLYRNPARFDRYIG